MTAFQRNPRGRVWLHDYINVTIGVEVPNLLMNKTPMSLIRVFEPDGKSPRRQFPS